MPYPDPYDRGYDFGALAPANIPDAGVRINGELDALALKTAELIARLALIQRSDGAPKNGVVTLDSLASTLRALIGSWTPRGTWVTARAYAVRDVVIGAVDGVSYICITAHTSGTFSTDVAAAKWQKLYGSDDALSSATTILSTGSSAAVSLATRFAVEVHVRDFGAVGDGSTDDTAAIQAAIAEAAGRASASQGGAVVVFEAKAYKVTDTLSVQASFVTLKGQSSQGSRLVFYSMTAKDWIKFGSVSGSAIRRGGISDLGIWGATGNTITTNANGSVNGAAISVENTYDMHFNRMAVEDVLCGMQIGRATNATTISNTVIVPNQSGSLYGINWWSPGDNSYRSDVLVMQAVVITCQWSNAIGINWRGFCNTMVGCGLRILHAAKGIVVSNPAGSSSYYPNFMNITDLEMEGFKTRALEITGGAEFKISNSDINNLSGDASQGSADDYAIYVTADASGSVTRALNITNSRVGGCRSNGLYYAGRDLQVDSVIFYSTSGASSGGAAAIRLASTVRNAQISNVLADTYGGLGRASYGVQVDSGAQSVVINGLDASTCVTGAVLDSTGTDQVSAIACFGPGSVPQGFVNSPGQRRSETRYNASGGAVESKVYNTATGANTSARFQMSTGTANGFVLSTLQDNSGAPYYQITGGSAVTGQFQDFAKHDFRNAAGTVSQFAVGQLLPSYADDAAAATGGIVVGGWYYNTTSSRERQRRS